jgi:ATP-binding cassette subfamily C protein LapB
LLIILPIFMYIAWRSASVMAAASADERQSSQTRDSLVAEIIAGRTTIKALALDNAMRPMWEDAHAENIERALYRGSRTDGYSNFGATLSLITTLLLTTVGALAIIDQKLTMGALIATNMLSGRIMGPMNQLVSQWRTYTGFQQSVDKLGTLFNAAGERLESALKLERPNGEIDIEAVSFAYAPGGKPVVNDISLTIKAGGVHALVGRNGSGKSTLLKIIQGLYRPSKGRVLLDGADISQFTRTELAGWMGYVPQDSILFTGTIRDNIVLRKPDADDDEVLKAAEEAGVHQFVIDLPDGYATDIGESGANLSGGQRQRIAIARALVGDPPVLILDEPSSSLDRQAEQELRRTLVEIGRDRTVIIVTHSPILLAACNDLIALDRGKVALAGPAQDILPKLFGTAPRRPEGDHAVPKPGPALSSAGGPKPMPQGGPKPMPPGGPKPMPQGGPQPPGGTKPGPNPIPPGGPQGAGGPQNRPAPRAPGNPGAGGTPKPALAVSSGAPSPAGAQPSKAAPPQAASPQAPGVRQAASPNKQNAEAKPAPRDTPTVNTRSGK